MTSPVRTMLQDSAVLEIVDAIRSQQYWVLGAAWECLERVTNLMQDHWQTVAYLDNATGLILVGTPQTAAATCLILPALGMEASATFVIPKLWVSVEELNAEIEDAGGLAPLAADGSQDLVVFGEALADGVDVGFMPTLLWQAMQIINQQGAANGPAD